MRAPDLAYTVAICTHSQAARLARTLADLGRLRAAEAPFELLVVDNASADGTPALLADAAWRPPGWAVRVVREGRLGIAHARNRALAEARGEWVLFLDDDETADPGWLCAIEQAVREHGPDALSGRIEVMIEDAPRPAWLREELLGFLGRLDQGPVGRWLGEGDTLFTGNSAFRRSVVEALGGFDTGLGRRGRVNTGGEDVEMFRRLVARGHRVRWVPEAVIYHRVSGAKLRRRYFLGLHYHQGQQEGARAAAGRSRVPPGYLLGQLWRAARAAVGQRCAGGADTSLRREMNVAYFVGYLVGWARRPAGPCPGS